MRTLFLAWQDRPNTRRWFVVARLDTDESWYSFSYVRQALYAEKFGFQPLLGFPAIQDVYRSERLFPLFENRLLSASRPDYPQFMERLNLPNDETDPLLILARTGGVRATDNLEVFLRPEPSSDGKYHILFFARGLSHLECARPYVEALKVGEKLAIHEEDSNDFDNNALQVQTQDGVQVGWVPRYLCSDLRLFLERCPNDIALTVERVNMAPAPVQQRLLCSFSAPWPETWEPFGGDDFRSLADELVTAS